MSVSESEQQELRGQLQRAVALHQAGSLDEAERLYEGILKRSPDQPETLSFLGVIKADKREDDHAIDLLRRAVTLKPDAANLLNNLGRVLLRLKRYEEAVEILERAVAAAPLPEAMANLAQAYRGAGAIDHALHCLDRLKGQKGLQKMVALERANIFSDLGRKESALAIVRDLLAARPDFAPAWALLAQLKRFDANDPEGKQLIALARAASDGTTGKKTLCYAAGKALDDQGDYAGAFATFSTAKEQAPMDFDLEETRRRFASLRHVFNAEYFDARASYGNSSTRPVFIVGMPRSGTTLAEQILSAHPDVYGGGELEYIGQLFHDARGYVPESERDQVMDLIDGPVVAELARNYLSKIDRHDSAARYFVDKMPHNFIYVGFIKLLFPQAKIIHCLRHPYDTCLSCFMRDFAYPHSYNQSLESLAAYYNLYRELMAHWMQLFGEDIFELNYEAFVSQPEETGRELFQFLNLDWQSEVLATEKNQRPIATPSNWQVREPIHAASVDRWKDYAEWLLPGLSGIDASYLKGLDA